MRSSLTARQAQVLKFISDCINSSGMPPTRTEIAKALNFNSPNSAEQHLKALCRKGYIELVKSTSRGIRLIEEGLLPSGLPLVGHVAAGLPILAEQNIEEHYQLLPDMFRPRADFLLRVKGMSMKNIGILDGDLLAVYNTQEERNGQIVVARLGDEVTVKRFRRISDSEVHLIAENDVFAPIIVDLNQQQMVIEGWGVGVIRRGQAL